MEPTTSLSYAYIPLSSGLWPHGESSTQTPAYLTSHDMDDKGQSQLPHILHLRNEPVGFSIGKPPGSICYSFVTENL